MRLLALTCLLLSPLGLPAAALPPGRSLLPPAGLFSFSVGNQAQLGRATALTLAAQAPGAAVNPLNRALRLETLQAAGNPWDVQASVTTAAAVSQGDAMLASFWMRAVGSQKETAEAQSLFVFELARDPWTKSTEYPISAGKDWRLIRVPFLAKASYGAGEAQMVFRMGFQPQAFELAGLSVVDYGSAVALADLPVTKVSYQGREADAPWRAGAQARIARYRMATLTVTVRGADGRPVAGAQVAVQQLRSAFGFGTAVSGDFMFRGSQGSRDQYQAEVKRLFNLVVEENAFKWQPLAGDWGPDYGMPLALESAQWAKDNGLRFRGHVLLWPSWRNSPKGLASEADDKAALRADILEHVRSTAATAKGLIDEWDVVNEPFDNHDISDLLGPSILADAFRTAHQADPGAKLCINDYAILSGGGGSTPHRDHYQATIESLLRSGAPLQRIGLQGHFGWALTGMDDAWAILERYGKLGPSLAVTEYDINIDDLALAADYTRDLLTLVYSHPKAEAFLMWGFWDGAHWNKNAPLYNADWTPKPALAVWEDLVLKQWRTQASGMTGPDGAYSVRGYKGDYQVTVTGPTGQAQTLALTLTAEGGAQMDVALK
jgi:GH35 family endo-1,4-beta-xylanase